MNPSCRPNRPLLPLLFGFVMLAVPGRVRGQSASFRGLVFGDAYWVAGSDDGALENRNGFWFRRIYLTFDFAISDAWSARLRTEMNSKGDFSSKAKLEPAAKDVYLRWKHGNHRLTFGLSGTPTWNVVESFWGYRSVEKTLLDLQKLGSSRDVGVAARGSLDGEKKIRYNVMLANGNGTSSETNKGKKGFLALTFYPASSVVFEVYGDYDDRSGDTDRTTVQGFVGFKGHAGRVGIQYAYQRRNVVGGGSVTLNALSVFGAMPLSKKVTGFARFDRMFDPNPDAAKISYLPFAENARSTLALAGVDIAAHEQVHFMPNVEAVFFDVVDGSAPAPTIMPRFTFFYTFK
ncbi:porin [Rhodocaloribacter sp.]